MKLSTILLAGLAAAVCSAAPLTAQTLTAWDAPVRVTAADGALAKAGGCEGCPDSGAHSLAQLTGDGYAEFIPAAGQQLVAGLGSDLTSSTSSSTIDYAFSIGPTGTWEVRERGVYKSDGTFATGDIFRVAVESGTVVYRKNGTAVYSSTVAPMFPVALDVTLYSLSASLSGATVVAGPAPTTTTITTTTTTTTTTTAGTATRTSIGPYLAVTDRGAYAKPALPSLGAAGTVVVDPVFQSNIARVTDSATRPGLLDRSYRTPSSPHQNAWSAAGTYLYVMSGDGSVLPYAFNATTGTARRLQPTSTGSGGLVLNFYIEPQFSYVNDSLIYGSVAGGSLRTIDQYDFTSGAYSRLFDLDAIVTGLAGTYIGGVASSAGQSERLMTFFGGASQDHHHFVVVFDRANPANRLLLDTTANTLNGQPTAIPLSFALHHVMIDRSGRYVMLYPTAADQSSTRKAPQSVAWDTQTGIFTEMPASAIPYGHDAFGYGVSVNQDCCTTTTWDAAQWQVRSLATPLVTRDMLVTVLSPKEVYLSDHTTWNNARPDRLMPYVSGLYRYGTTTTAWRAWDDEIIAVQTDAAAGVDPSVWRFAQHRSNVANDGDATRVSFWYEPRPNVSGDGQWVMFTSNWEKTLGTDPTGEIGSAARQDVFIVHLTPAGSTATITPPPTVVPVAVTTTSLPSGRATVGYSAAMQATGGSGSYTWSVTSGALPAGLALGTSTGVFSGTPTTAGTTTFSVNAADASNPANIASATFSITVGAAPVQVTTASLPAGRQKVAYNATLQAAGGTGSFAWSIASGALPGGLTLNATTGAVSGTPTTAGTYAVTVSATDAADATNIGTVAYSVVTAAAVTITSPRVAPNAKRGVAYSYAVLTANVQGTPSWDLAGGSMPPGMTLNSATGVISGACQTAGTWYFNARVKDASTDDTLTLTLKVR